MKKTIGIILALIMTSCALSACGSDQSGKSSTATQQSDVTSQTSEENSTDSQSSQQQSDASEAVKSTENANSTVEETTAFVESMNNYVPPAEIFDLDTDIENPSTKDIRFEYDDKGRITECYFLNVFQGYTYIDDENVVSIFTLDNNNIIIAEDNFVYKKYDKNAGVTEYKGYYFRNLVF